MIREEFRPILENLEAGRCAVLHRTADGVEYTRLFRPRERLILLGGGHIAQPLCRMAAMLDFDVTVVDDRSDFAAASRFPEADWPGTLLDQTNSDLSAIRYLAESGEPKALLLVLISTGSTSVRSGSLMAVNRLGTGYGTIGGGCSEAAAMQRARKIIGTGGSCVIEIDMTNDVAADEGMVCGGTMRVLIEDASENGA